MTPALKVPSFAKINLALAVLGRRNDGYHEIQTVFQTIDLHDELEFRDSGRMGLRCDNLPGTLTEDNLVWRAALALRRAAGVTGGAEIILRKNIPAGAGLGGGSSNAAATLLGLSALWRLERSAPDLEALAAGLGADVPFFLHGGTALGVGKGTEIHPLPEIPPAHLVVIFPGIRISTAEAYRSLRLELTSPQAALKIQSFCGQLRGGFLPLTGIFNDFETSILPAYPAIGEAKAFLSNRGATATLLSGSGSSVFGFFLEEESALAASRAVRRETWRAFPAKTLSRAEYFHAISG